MESILLNLPLSINTERLFIRAPQAGDGAVLHTAYLESRLRLVRWFRWAQEEDSVEEYEILCRQKHAEYLSREHFMYLLFERTGGEFAGGASLIVRKADPLILEVGYWLRSGYEGKGFMSETVRALLRIAFEDLKAIKVILRADAENQRSQAVALHNGFSYEGIMRHFEPQHNNRMHMIDMCYFSILASEYAAGFAPDAALIQQEHVPANRETPVLMDADYKRWLMLYDVPERLETERLMMRICEDGDGLLIFAAVNAGRERLGKYLRWAAEADTPMRALAWVRRNSSRFYKREDFSYLLFDKASGQLLGGAGIGLTHANGATFELGYWLTEAAEGKGYASEASRALVQLAFDQLQSTRVEIVAETGNRLSRAVAERVGFTFEMVMRQQGRNARENTPVDLAFYSLIRPEYEARRAEFAVLR